MPRSPNLTLPSSVMKIFSSFISLWRIPCSCRYLTADVRVANISHNSCYPNNFYFIFRSRTSWIKKNIPLPGLLSRRTPWQCRYATVKEKNRNTEWYLDGLWVSMLWLLEMLVFSIFPNSKRKYMTACNVDFLKCIKTSISFTSYFIYNSVFSLSYLLKDLIVP